MMPTQVERTMDRRDGPYMYAKSVSKKKHREQNQGPLFPFSAKGSLSTPLSLRVDTGKGSSRMSID